MYRHNSLPNQLIQQNGQSNRLIQQNGQSNRLIQQNGQPNKLINQNMQPNHRMISTNVPPGGQPNRGAYSFNRHNPINSPANKPSLFKSNIPKSIPVQSKTVTSSNNQMTSHTTSPIISHPIGQTKSQPKSQTKNQTNPINKTSFGQSYAYNRMNNSSGKDCGHSTNKTNNENQTASGKKRPLERDDDLLDLDKSKIRKTLEDIDWNVPIDELDVSEIEQFKDNTIDRLPLDDLDLDLVRDITDLEFEMSMNESLKAKVEELDFYGLPLSVKEKLKEERKVESLYEWQDALMRKLVESEHNSVYCVPTSGGKTLVAELMIFRELLLKKRNALFVFPFISIVQEKLKSLISFSLEFDFLIEEYAGEKGSIPVPKRAAQRSLYIATYEKAHLLLTCLQEEGRLDEIGLIVIDELHMLGDGTARGCNLESLLLLCTLAKQRDLFDARLLAMSATISNFDQLGKFLDAEVEERNFRPVELIEFVLKEQTVYRYDKAAAQTSTEMHEIFKHERCLEKRKILDTDPDNLAGLLEESMPDSPVLIFCATKKNCENVVSLLCRHLRPDLRNCKTKERSEVLENLQDVTDGRINDILLQSIPFGIVFHHSGLTAEEREIFETGFLTGALCVIACTSTLSAGVNLPAARVIIRAPYVANKFISSAQYKQMIGRAGRAGMCDKPGESILIIKDKDFAKVPSLFVDPSLECISSIHANAEQGISRIFLSLIHLGLVDNVKQVREVFLNQTLYGIQFGAGDELDQMLSGLITKFYELGLIAKPDGDQDKIQITKMGKGAVKGLIDVNKCPKLYADLKKVSGSISVTTKFHLFYICTLVFDSDELPNFPDRTYVHETFLKLNAEERQAAGLIGIDECTVQKYLIGGNPSEDIRRFFLTLIVYESYRDKISLYNLGRKCGIGRGTLQQMLQRFSTNSMSLIRFIEELDDLWGIHSLLSGILADLCLCAAPELTPFLELPHVKIGRAKKLYNLGFKTLEDIAELKPALLREKLDYKIHLKCADDIIKYAKRVFSTKAEALQLETARYLKLAEIRQSQ